MKHHSLIPALHQVTGKKETKSLTLWYCWYYLWGFLSVKTLALLNCIEAIIVRFNETDLMSLVFFSRNWQIFLAIPQLTKRDKSRNIWPSSSSCTMADLLLLVIYLIMQRQNLSDTIFWACSPTFDRRAVLQFSWLNDLQIAPTLPLWWRAWDFLPPRFSLFCLTAARTRIRWAMQVIKTIKNKKAGLSKGSDSYLPWLCRQYCTARCFMAEAG